MPRGMEVGLSPCDFVFDGGTASPNVRCGQTAGCTKMPLGMKVGLGPGDFVFDGDSAPPEKKAHPPPPNFWPMSIVAKRLDGSRCHLVLR